MTDEHEEQPGDANYRDELGRVLRLQDISQLRTFLENQARRFGDDGQVASVAQQTDAELATLMHRMILARADLADLHAKSKVMLGTDPASSRRTPGQPRRPREA